MIAPTEACGAADVVFVIDASGSINERNEGNWDLLLNFVIRIVSDPRFPIGRGRNQFQFGVVVYSTNGRVEFNLGAHSTLSSLVAAIQAINYDRDRTNIAHGLELARENIFGRSDDRPLIPNILILITDGIPNEREGDTINQADLTKAAGIFIISVGITEEINEAELISISSNDVVLTVSDFAALDNLLDSLAESTCEAGMCVGNIFLVQFYL